MHTEQTICFNQTLILLSRRSVGGNLLSYWGKKQTLTGFKYHLSKFMDCKKFHSSECRRY